MLKSSLCLLIAIGFPLGGFIGMAHAQSGNPLRVGQSANRAVGHTPTAIQHNAQPRQIEGHVPEMPREVWKAIYEPRRDQNTDAHKQPLNPTESGLATQIIVDPKVAPTIHVSQPRASAQPEAAIPQSDLAGINDMLSALQAKQNGGPQRQNPAEVSQNLRINELENSNLDRPAGLNLATGIGNAGRETGPSDARFDQQRFQKLLKQIAINTCIVLCVAVGFILIAKQWFFKQAKPSVNVVDNTIQITSTLRLSPKSNLFLVAAGKHRLVVASDQNGINSVVPLTDSFASTLDSFADAGQEATSSNSPVAGSDSLSGLYSLASLGQATGKKVLNTDDGGEDTQAEIRRKMEAALDEHGLRELFVQTMRSQS